MSFTLIDHFNGFQSLKQGKRFSAGVQSTYFALLAEFNRQRFPAELSLSTRDLKELAGLKSVATAHECRNVLKNNKLIDFETRAGITVYRLLTDHLPKSNRMVAEHQPNGNRTLQAGFNVHACGDLRPKTEENRSIAGTGARKIEDEEEIQEYWERDLHGTRLTVEHLSELDVLIRKYGREWLKSAMKEASEVNTNSFGLSFRFLRGVIDRKLKGGKKLERERAEKNQRRSEREYEVPDYSNVPWNDDGSDS